MRNQGVIALTNEVFIDQRHNQLKLSKRFAEKNISVSARRFARFNGTHYVWIWGKTSYIVAYELPRLFNIAYFEVLKYLMHFCYPYIRENNLTDNVLYPKFMDNYNKSINM